MTLKLIVFNLIIIIILVKDNIINKEINVKNVWIFVVNVLKNQYV